MNSRAVYKVVDIIRRLEEYGVEPSVIDPWADPEIAGYEYGIELKSMEDASEADCIIVAVAHDEFIPSTQWASPKL